MLIIIMLLNYAQVNPDEVWLCAEDDNKAYFPTDRAALLWRGYTCTGVFYWLKEQTHLD